jgi:3-oxoacyl-[acyl-carrier protein] reductase
MKLLRGKSSIVTGASRGIGRAIALTMARHGSSLVINGNCEDLLKQLAVEIEQLGQECAIHPGDVANPETAVGIVQTAIKRFGRIDVLVNNAGINMRSSTLETKLEDWQRVMEVNLYGTLHCCVAVLPHFIKQQSGKIVNISSTVAKTPHMNAAPSYGSSKAAVNYLTQHLALEMAKHGICVNAICPGPIETDMSMQWSEEYRQEVLSKIPLRRLGMPENVADGVLFLSSKMSDFITGETININGGTYMN